VPLRLSLLLALTDVLVSKILPFTIKLEPMLSTEFLLKEIPFLPDGMFRSRTGSVVGLDGAGGASAVNSSPVKPPPKVNLRWFLRALLEGAFCFEGSNRMRFRLILALTAVLLFLPLTGFAGTPMRLDQASSSASSTKTSKTHKMTGHKKTAKKMNKKMSKAKGKKKA
jgi:hypothetical protein